MEGHRSKVKWIQKGIDKNQGVVFLEWQLQCTQIPKLRQSDSQHLFMRAMVINQLMMSDELTAPAWTQHGTNFTAN